MLQRLAESIVGLVPVRYQTSARQFIKFSITGVIGAVIDFGTYNVLTRGFQWTAFYVVFGQKIIMANNISVLFALVSNFLFNKYWTFRDPSKQVARQWAGYFVLNIITWTLNQLLTSYFTFQVPLIESIFGDMKDNASKALAIGVILFLNFLGSKFIVFRKQQPA